MLRTLLRSVALLFTFCILAVVIAGFSYFQFVMKPAMVKDFMTHMKMPVPAVMAARAETQAWAPRLPAVGTFTAFKGINVAPQVGGVVTALHFDSGQEVKEGQSLLDIDSSTEAADLKNGEAQLRNAEVALDRQRKLISSANTAQANYDSALATRDSAAATVLRYKAIIAQKALKAPFAGRLGIRKVDVGAFVSPGLSVVTLQQLDPIYIDFSLPQQDTSVLRIGQTVDVEVDAYPGKTFHGRIQSIDARVNQDTRNILVRGEIPNPDKALLPGMFGNINVLAGEPEHVVTVPRTAVTYSLYGDTVFVLKASSQQAADAKAAPKDGDGSMVAERRVVRVGETQADSIAIQEGVSPGDLVVAAGQVKLMPNAVVRVDPNAALKPAAVRPKA